MNIRPANANDVEDIAALVREFDSTLVSQPESATPFWDSMSVPAHAKNLESSRFNYLLAEIDGTMVGFIAMRDGSHLFNLFVIPSKHRQGIGRALWCYALNQAKCIGSLQCVTVNASLNAVPVYRAFGFKEVGSVVHQHGIAFVPMLYRVAENAA